MAGKAGVTHFHTGLGNLAPDKDAAVLILKQDSLEIVHLFARGRHVICDGRYVEPSRQEQQVASGKE